MSDPIRLYRPLYIEYYTIGYILRYEKYIYDMTENEFINACMVYSNGALNPHKCREIYRQLMEEAGLNVQS